MKTHYLLKRLLLLWIFAFSASFWGQTNIIPVRTDVGGFPTWTDNNVAGSAYVQLLKATSSTITPAMDFNSFTGETLNFKARTFGGSTAAEIILTVSISIDNGTNWIVLGTRTPASSSMNTQAPFDLSSYNGTQVKVKFSVGGTADGIGVGIDDIAFTGIPAASGPEIVASPSSLIGFTYIVGSGPSAEKSFNLSGSNLTNDITATAPANFEVSTTTGTGFGSAVSLTQTGGNVASTTLYVRMNAGLPVDTYGGNMVLTSTGATAMNIALSGNVTPMPAKPIITAPTAQSGTVGAAYSYQIVASENPTSYALASGALPTGFTLNTTTGVISGTPTAAGAFNTTITATNAAGTSAPVVFDFNISKGIQTVVLSDLNLTVGGADVTLPAITDKGITILYSSSNTAVASITGNMLTIGEAGSATISASNAGNANYEAFSAIFTVNVATAPCGLEGFSNSLLTDAYSSGSFIGNNGISWSYIASRDENGDANNSGIDGKAIMLRRVADNSAVSSSTISTGIGNFSVKLYKGFTGSGDRQVELFINGISRGTSTAFNDFGEHLFVVNNINVAGDFTIEIKNLNSTQVIIDDITWTCFANPSTTWTGTWSNGVPDENKDVIIDFDYAGGSFNSKSLTVNASKTLKVTSSISTGAVTNNGNIVVANNANFVQSGTFTPGAGSTFKVLRDTKVVERLDYNSWSSPMMTSDQTLKAFSPATVDNRFLTYSNRQFVPVSNVGTTKFTPGAGYLIRTPNNYTTAQAFNGIFEGTVPNWDVVTYTPTGVVGQFVFLGNPYPSAISMADFATVNTAQLESATFYIWNSESKMNTSNVYVNPYVTHTVTGSNPAGYPFYIPVGQGFIIDRGLTNSGDFIFNNTMKQTAETGVFAKAAVTDKFWLQMTSPSGSKPQLLVGFTSNATLGYDAGYDGKLLESNGDVIYSTVDDKSLVINALGAFSSSDVVNVTANFVSAGNYTFNIIKKEGVFANGQQIYLKDNITGVETELTSADYIFAATEGLQADRFTVSFTKGVLGNANVVKDQSSIYATDQVVYVKAASKIASIEIYDMIGKLMKTTKNVYSENGSLPIAYQGIAVVKVTLENGEVVTKKIILK